METDFDKWIVKQEGFTGYKGDIPRTEDEYNAAFPDWSNKPSWETVTSNVDLSDAGFALKQLRLERDALLRQSDWTQGADVPESIKTAWATYRQALRDITDTYSSVDDVVWPTKP